MYSAAADVQTYLDELPADRRAAVEKLRGLCLKHLRDYVESMQDGMVVYERQGARDFAFANQRDYLSLYLLDKTIVDEFRKTMPAARFGKMYIYFRNFEKIDFEGLAKLLKRIARR